MNPNFSDNETTPAVGEAEGVKVSGRDALLAGGVAMAVMAAGAVLIATSATRAPAPATPQIVRLEIDAASHSAPRQTEPAADPQAEHNKIVTLADGPLIEVAGVAPSLSPIRQGAIAATPAGDPGASETSAALDDALLGASPGPSAGRDRKTEAIIETRGRAPSISPVRLRLLTGRPIAGEETIDGEARPPRVNPRRFAHLAQKRAKNPVQNPAQNPAGQAPTSASAIENAPANDPYTIALLPEGEVVAAARPDDGLTAAERLLFSAGLEGKATRDNGSAAGLLVGGPVTPASSPTAPVPAVTEGAAAQAGASGDASASAAVLVADAVAHAEGAVSALAAPLVIAMASDIPGAPETVKLSLEKGETFVDALKRARVDAVDRNEAALAFGKHYNMRRLLPGQEFTLTTAEPNETIYQYAARADANDRGRLLALDFRADAENRIGLKRRHDGGYDGEKRIVELTTKLQAIEGRIEGSLFVSARAKGAPHRTVADLANIFAYDVDFQREIFGGDEFEAVYEVRYDEDGREVGAGEVLFARLKWRGRTKEKAYYRFAAKDGGSKADYFDASGQSAKRLLMKTPIDGARLSSGFGTRKHPILGYAKAHKGVDFAARRGTPIYAAGDGVVERANRYGSFGNYVRIRHSQGYKTAYAHLKGFAKGMRAGKRVEQGDVIGYVGTTGRSTGPHLHYEVHHNGKAVNPQRLKIATGVELKGEELVRFRSVRDGVDALRVRHAKPDAADLLASEDEDSEEPGEAL